MAIIHPPPLEKLRGLSSLDYLLHHAILSIHRRYYIGTYYIIEFFMFIILTLYTLKAFLYLVSIG